MLIVGEELGSSFFLQIFYFKILKKNSLYLKFYIKCHFRISMCYIYAIKTYVIHVYVLYYVIFISHRTLVANISVFCIVILCIPTYFMMFGRV